MALLFYSQFDDPADWGRHLGDAMPGLDFRVWPNVGNPGDIEAALVWKAPEGELRKYPNLKLIINLGAGVDSIVKDRTLPAGIPIVRIADEEMSRMMSQFVLAAVLRHYRDFVSFARAQRERRWHYLHPHEAATCRVGVMGLGNLGAMAASELVRQGFRVAGWARSPKSIEVSSPSTARRGSRRSSRAPTSLWSCCRSRRKPRASSTRRRSRSCRAAPSW